MLSGAQQWSAGNHTVSQKLRQVQIHLHTGRLDQCTDRCSADYSFWLSVHSADPSCSVQTLWLCHKWCTLTCRKHCHVAEVTHLLLLAPVASTSAPSASTHTPRHAPTHATTSHAAHAAHCCIAEHSICILLELKRGSCLSWKNPDHLQRTIAVQLQGHSPDMGCDSGKVLFAAAMEVGMQQSCRLEGFRLVFVLAGCNGSTHWHWVWRLYCCAS